MNTYCPPNDPSMVQTRQVLDQMKTMGFDDFEISYKVVMKYREAGKLNELDHIATEIDHITNLQKPQQEDVQLY